MKEGDHGQAGCKSIARGAVPRHLGVISNPFSPIQRATRGAVPRHLGVISNYSAIDP